MEKRNIFLALVISIISIYCLASDNVKAGTNMDGGGSGGGTQNGTDLNHYSSGDDGVRITVIDIATNLRATGTLTIDYYRNNKEDKTVMHFGKVCKIEYMGVGGYNTQKSLTQSSEKYLVNDKNQRVAYQIGDIPTIISSSKGNSNIDAIKKYFNNEDRLRGIASRVGMAYDEMTNGNYKILLEPIIYLTYEGNYIAMTAHEAALLDMMLGGTRVSGGKLRAKFVSFTHKNLPLAIFLKKKDLGINRWTGSKYDRVNNGQILAYLGIGILSFNKTEEKPDTDIEAGSFTYRPDTDVITSVEVSASGGNGATCDNPITVQFSGELITTTQVSGIVIPSGGSRLVWFRWHTPAVTEKTTSTISVSLLSGGSANGQIKIKINPIQEKEPSNPTADDEKPYGWISAYLPSIPSFPKIGALSKYASPVTSLSWHTYTCTKSYEIVGSYVDKKGYSHNIYGPVYSFSTNDYSASIFSTQAVLSPDPITKPANLHSSQIKSGYGVELRVTSNITTSGGNDSITGMQTSVTYFPEFFYKDYRRIGKLSGASPASTIEFPVNLYSIRKNRVHFLPIWYPDKEYKVYTEILDAWTPAGMLCNYTTASIQVNKSLWDDWHIAVVEDN